MRTTTTQRQASFRESAAIGTYSGRLGRLMVTVILVILGGQPLPSLGAKTQPAHRAPSTPATTAATMPVERAAIEQDWIHTDKLQGSVEAIVDRVEAHLCRGRNILADIRKLSGNEMKADTEALRNATKSRDELLAARSLDREAWKKVYLETRWAVRRAAMKNPLLNDNRGLLFVRRHHATINHQCARRRSRYNRLGGEICLLENLGDDRINGGLGRVVSLTAEKFPAGVFGRPDLSFDGKRIVFGFAAADTKDTTEPPSVPNEFNSIGNGTFYQIYEMGLDGKSLPRRITQGKTRREESTDPIYLPDGRIGFMSPRAGGMVMCGDWAWADCMFTVKPDGSDIRQITWSKEGEWDPSLMDDGSIMFTRWEYMMRFWRPTQLIWNVRPDGMNPRIVGGYLTRERNYARCRQIPGTSKVVCVEAHHHNDGSGNILIVDLSHGRGTDAGETRLVSGSGDCPFPLNEKYFLVSYDPQGTGSEHNRSAGRHALYLADTYGGLELIYRDPHLSAMYPTPIRSRRRPAVVSEVKPSGVKEYDKAAEYGKFFVQNVYEGLPESMHGKARYLRVVQAHERHIHTSPCNIWVGMGGFETKTVLGTVPVEADGSAYFRVPAKAAVFFSVLDEKYQALHTMRMTTDVKPGEYVGCIGCHEPMKASPRIGKSPLAAQRPASEIEAPPWNEQNFGYPNLVQPILDKHCVECHDGTKDKNRSFDLRAGHTTPEVYIPDVWTTYAEGYKKHYKYESYWTLLPYVKFANIHTYHTPPGSWGSRVSPLMEILSNGHKNVKLNEAEWRTLCAWIDCNVPYLDDFRKFAVDPKIRAEAANAPASR